MDALPKIGKDLPKLKVMRTWKGKKYPDVGRQYKNWGKPLSTNDRLEQFAAGANEEFTLPERIIEKALIIQGYKYDAQVPIAGAHARVDFLVFLGVPGHVIRVQGEYWHTLGNRRATDLIQWTLLKGQGYAVWDAWEQEVYDHVLNGSILTWVDAELVKV